MDNFLIRHTMPDIASGVCYGTLDVAAGKNFIAEAHQVLRTLQTENIHPQVAIFSSPLKRCRVLAEFLAPHFDAEVLFDARLGELNFGAWEGKRWDEIDLAASKHWTADVWNRAPPGGETYAQLGERVNDFLSYLIARAHPQTIIISHAGPLRTMLAQLLKVPKTIHPPFDVHIGRTSRLTREFSGEWTLRFLNR